MKKLLISFLFLVIISCDQIEFVYDDNGNLENPLYERTEVTVYGIDTAYVNSYLPIFFGVNKNNEYRLAINIDEEKTKLSVEKNQAVSNIRYKIKFFYSLFSNEKNCLTFEKQILSKFTVIPKSSGYDFGSDTSLEQNYENAINQNLNNFVSLLGTVDINKCL